MATYRGIITVLAVVNRGALVMGGRGGVDHRLKDAVLEARFAVVLIDYRLLPETKLSEIIRDAEDAAAWLQEHGPKLLKVDTRRLRSPIARADVGVGRQWPLGG